MDKPAALLRTSVMGLIAALLTFNVMAHDIMDIRTVTTEEAVSAVPVAPAELIAITPPVVMNHTGDQYVPVTRVSENLSQVVFYRPSNAGAGVSNVYVDRELQSALKSGEFTVFCVAPGDHNIEAYMDDQPSYSGSESPTSIARVEGGKTYFIETNHTQGVGTPITVNGNQVEEQLFAYKATNILNRASAVRECETDTNAAALGNILFRFDGKTRADIEAGGVGIAKSIAQQLRAHPEITHVNVVGHADPVGDTTYNQRLSVQRAETVKRILISNGVMPEAIFTSGQGSSEPVIDCTAMRGTERTYCNRANRRVDIQIQN
ncbi:MAG: OmpA family protein [Enterobacteriaceae bacterium]|nr:OmpA family protein [Enterobacteriaceae bacterium]